MREILFRGKSIVADSPNTPGYWLKGNYISRVLDFEDGTTVIENHIVERDSYINIYLDSDTEVWPETIGQYIGLKDRDGRRIFEGDILESPVKRVGQKLGNLIVITDIRECKYLALYVSEYSIIGNVYDNPELLGEHERTERT